MTLPSSRIAIILAGAGALVALATTAPAQGGGVSGQSAPVLAPTAPIPLDPAVRAGTLPNGLHYYIRHNGRPEHRVELRLVVNAGSVLEDNDQRGLAHFVEHMEFNGTRRFKKNDIVSYLESIGVRFGADLNAYTGFDETVYILPIPTDKPGLVGRGFDVLQDWASGALFDSTEVVNERGVVLEEWRLGLGAESRIRDKQFPVLFKGSKYADRLPIGLPDIIRGATPAPVRRFYHDWYRPDLMAVIAVGDVNPDSIEALVKSRFSGLRGPANERPRPVVAVPGNDSTLVTIATDREEDVSTVQVLYKHAPVPLRTVADYRTMLVRELYNSMFNSRLSEITKRPNAPFSFASSSYGPFVRASDVYFLAAVVPDGGIIPGLEALLREAKRVDEHGFLASELARAKASLLRGFETAYAERDKSESGSYAEEYIRYFLDGEASPGIAWEYRDRQSGPAGRHARRSKRVRQAVDYRHQPGGGGGGARQARRQGACRERSAGGVPPGGRRDRGGVHGDRLRRSAGCVAAGAGAGGVREPHSGARRHRVAPVERHPGIGQAHGLQG